MKEIFITSLLHKSGLFTGDNSLVLDPQDTQKVVEKFTAEKSSDIEVWGLTQSLIHDSGTVLKVNDHINCTGNNPLRNNLDLFNITFPDLSKIYIKQNNGIITTGWGKNYPGPTNEHYPTAYFCYYGIISGALGLPRITGYLVNQKPT